jgi:hypothetical protein
MLVTGNFRRIAAEESKARRKWALVDDFRTLPLGQIVAGIPHIGELSLL